MPLTGNSRATQSPTASNAPLAELAGKVAFITGGSSGIGLGIARACAEAGMRVIVTYQTQTHADEAVTCLTALGCEFRALRLDITDREAVMRSADEAEALFGPVNLLCSNAGVGSTVLISEATFADWDFAMGVNVGGLINCLQAFLPRMVARREPAHVLATASMSGLFHGGRVGIYTATKFAVVGAMEALRAELAPKGLGVSLFCPGLVTSNIFDAERSRPAHLAPSRVHPDDLATRAARYRGFMAAGMDPLECGRRVLRGVRQNDLYILTHPEFEEGLRERFEALLASFPADSDDVPPERLRAEQFVLRSAIYGEEKTRR